MAEEDQSLTEGAILDFNVSASFADSPILKAVKAQDKEQLKKLLLERFAQREMPRNVRETICGAIRRGYFSWEGGEKPTLMQFAADANDVELGKILKEAGIDVSAGFWADTGSVVETLIDPAYTTAILGNKEFTIFLHESEANLGRLYRLHTIAGLQSQQYSLSDIARHHGHKDLASLLVYLASGDKQRIRRALTTAKGESPAKVHSPTLEGE
jgi:hypothetical protein